MAAATALPPSLSNSQLFAESSFSSTHTPPMSSFSSTQKTEQVGGSQALSSTMTNMSLHPSTSETLSSAHDLLAAHNALISQFRAQRKWLSQQTQELLRNSEKYKREHVTEDHNRKKRRRSSTATAVDWDEEQERAREDDDVDIDRDVYGDDDYDDRISGDDGDDAVGRQSSSDDDRADTQSVKQEEDDGDDRQSLDDASDGAKSSDEDDYDPTEPPPRVIRPDLPPAKRARVERYPNYIPDEETIRNDYSQRYVDSGEWPQNWVLGAEPERRFEEYPKQQRLLNLKKQAVNEHSLPPHYLSLPLSPTDATSSTNTRFQNLLSTLHPSKFDVILIDPPFSSSFTWDNLQDLAIPSLAGDPSFVFLWVGSGAGEGLERGREVLAKWGYRRCEDVVWVKTNKTTNKGPGTDPPTTSLLTRTKQHCLIGIRGTVRRSNDSWFLHCNVDTDVIIWEGDPSDPARKPPEMYTLIENFCLGMRRLEIFGRLSSLRRGWVTVLAPGQEVHLPQLSSSGDVSGSALRPANSTSSSASSSSGKLALTNAVDASEAKTPQLVDIKFHVDGDEGGLARRWQRAKWEQGIRDMAGPAGVASTASGGTGGGAGKYVVPMTPEIDALRPKSPVRGERGERNGGGGDGNRNNNHHTGGHQPNNNSGGGGMAMNMGIGMMGGSGMSMMAQPMATPVMRFAGGGGGGNNNARGAGVGFNGMLNTPQGMVGGGGMGNANQLMAQPMMAGTGNAMNNLGMNGMNAMNMNVGVAGMDGAWNNGMGNPMMGMGVGMGMPGVGGMGMHMGGGGAGGGTPGVGPGMNPMMSMMNPGSAQLGMMGNMDTGWDNVMPGMGVGLGMGMNPMNMNMGMGLNPMNNMGGGMPGMMGGAMPGMSGMNMGMGMGNNMGMTVPGMVGMGAMQNGGMNPMGHAAAMGMPGIGMGGMNMNMGGPMGMNQRQQRGGGGGAF